MRKRLCLVVAAVSGLAVAAVGWHGPGHDMVGRNATVALPADLPAFFRDGGQVIGHFAVDPDNWTRPIATTQLSDAEGPDHFLDIERMPDMLDKMPVTRYKFLAVVHSRGLTAADVGLLPYAIVEWTQRLTIAFAEHRRWPDDQAIRTKCLVYAGILAHYSGDLCQPLHTTVHYDGRIVPGQPRKRGIHLKMDAALAKLGRLEMDVRPEPFDDVLAAVMAEFKRSYELVDRVYELENDLPDYEAPLDEDSKAARFLRDRLRASTRFTGSLFLTAWRKSADVKFPEWHQRPPVRPDELAARRAMTQPK